MQSIVNYLKKNWVVLALLILMVGAFFVRVYHFNDWLYFKMDQSRDALLINNVLEKGPGYLPLLGARAGAVKLENGFLRLGPAYYYFQYISAKIFNSNEPYVLAYPDLFFSLAVIPLLYLFVRLYFPRKISMLITAMYAFSFLIVEYSRFAWNPNSLQFFIILSFYGLLRFLNDQNEANKKWWLALWVFGITIGSQLHFFGFFSLLGISGLLILAHLRVWDKETLKTYFKKEALKKFSGFVGISLAVFLVLYTPVIISDIKAHGQNSKNFIEALSAKPEKKPLGEKLSKDVSENLKYYCLLTTSECYGNNFSKNDLFAIVLTVLILIAGLFLAIKNVLREKNQLAKDFLLLLLFWSLVFLILTIPVSFQLRPRFYIVVFATPFIFLGLIYEFLEKRFGKKAFWACLAITALILGLNVHGISAWFSEQAKSQEKNFSVKRTLILKNKDGVTLGQLERATDWMYARHEQGKNLYYYVKPEHVRPIDFLLVQKNDKELKFASMKINEDPNAEYFAITPAGSKLGPVEKKFKREIQVVASEQIGQLMVSQIIFPQRAVSQTFRLKTEGGAEDRFYWKDVFANSSKNKK
jgi:4-amino-4-deoxy-L-arabinose transferase-like glycosyltransferase